VLRDDGNNDIAHSTLNASIMIDCTVPTYEVNSPVSGGVYQTLPVLDIHFNDNFNIDRAFYQMDGCSGEWTEMWAYNSLSSDTSISWQIPAVAEGSHTIFFKIGDDAGNVNDDSCSAMWSFTYDATPPQFTVLSPMPDRVYYSPPELSIQYQDNLNLDKAYFQINECSGTWSEIWTHNSNSSDTTASWTVPVPVYGDYQIYFKVIDDAGHVNSDTCSYSWDFSYASYTCGDANSDGLVNVSDAVYIINYVFTGGDPPSPLVAGNVNCDIGVNVSDAVWIINYIFVNGNEPCDWDGDGIPDC
jgi:hypothetical protein